MEHKYWCVSWKQHCRVMRSCTRCVLQCFLFFLFFLSPPSREWVWLTSSLHQGKKLPPPLEIYMNIAVRWVSRKLEQADTKGLHPTRLFWCTWIPLLFSTENKRLFAFLKFIFQSVSVTFKTNPMKKKKTVAPEQILYCPVFDKNLKFVLCFQFFFFSFCFSTALIGERHLLLYI